MSAALGRTFASLAVPNYRRYFSGQVVSITGNWMQMVAEMWLVVELTGSGVSVGLTAALQFLPLLLFAVWGGLLADRLDKRRLLMTTQSLMVLPALTLWALTISGSVELWMVYALVLTRGALTAVDNPARQSFVVELVGDGRVVNAVALNSVIVHTARVLGPAAAGLVIALFGVGTCFLLNAVSFMAMLAALKTMDADRLHALPPAIRGRGQLRSALAHVAATPALWVPLAMMAVVGTLSYNFQVLFPLLASFTWDGTAATYAALTAAMGIGSVTGALVTGARGRVSTRLLILSATGFGAFMLLAAAAPTVWLQLAALVPLGAVSVAFSAGVQSAMQLAVDPAMRGRVMALYSMVFLGSTPVGAPLVGWVAEAIGPRAGLVLGGAAALAAAAGARVAYSRLRARRAPARRRCESSSRTRTASRPLLHETRP
jgi:MFS family permease